MKRTRLLALSVVLALLTCAFSATSAFALGYMTCHKSTNSSITLSINEKDTYAVDSVVISYKTKGMADYKTLPQASIYYTSDDLVKDGYEGHLKKVTGLKPNTKYYFKVQVNFSDETAPTTLRESFYTTSNKTFLVKTGGKWKRIKVDGYWVNARYKSFSKHGAVAFIERQKVKTTVYIKGYGSQSETDYDTTFSKKNNIVTAVKMSGKMYGLKYTAKAYQVGRAKIIPVYKKGDKYYANGYPAFTSLKKFSQYIDND